MRSYTKLFCCLSIAAPVFAYAAVGDIAASGALKSSVATGTAPLSVSSTTQVPNLNADMLDGKHASDFALQADGYVSVPVSALNVTNSSVDPWDVGSGIEGPRLGATGNTFIQGSFVVPGDAVYGPPGKLGVVLRVYNPAGNGVCLAKIELGGAIEYIDGGSRVGRVITEVAPFPAYLGDNTTLSYRAENQSTPPAGSVYRVQFIRRGDDPNDNCGDLRLVGWEFTYPKM